MSMPFFASPLGMSLCVALALTLMTINIFDVIAIRKQKYSDIKHQRAMRVAHKAADFAQVAMFVLLIINLIR